MDMPEPAVVEHDVWHELQPLLDHELTRLPQKYQVVILLCDLEGKSRKDVARQLGLAPEGTGRQPAGQGEGDAGAATRPPRLPRCCQRGIGSGVVAERGLLPHRSDWWRPRSRPSA